MNYQEEYNKKLVSAEEAAKVVKDGDWVDYGFCVNAPVAVDKAIAARAAELKDVKFRNGVTMWMPEIAKVENAGERFTWNTWHCSGVDRKILNAGFGYFAPMRYAELPRFYREGNIKTNVAVIQVTPMDAFGNFNFGLSTSHLEEVLAAADTVIVEVNENMPWVFGLRGSEINIKDVDYIVEGDNPDLAALPAAGPASDIDIAIANMVVEQIPNGACLQLGIGGMPNAIGNMIAESDLKDLGVHTEMYVDGFAAICRAGKITGKHKSIDKGRQVFAFAAGTQDLYDFMDCNPDIMGAPVDYTNDPYVVGQIDNFISINNAIDIDILGQVNAESAGTKQISGTGGQLDFMLGAYLSKGGKSFICLASTHKNKDGSISSNIRPTLAPGATITDPRSCTMYVATEYGMVNLKGLSTWQRTEALIGLAHPDFREELIAEAEKMNIWRKSNK